MSNFRTEPTSPECQEFHRVEPRLYADKSAFKDAIACGIPIKCSKCGMFVTQLPDMAVAVFGAPPKWFLRVARNAAKQLIVIDTPKRS